jgi:hypothetical protein
MNDMTHLVERYLAAWNASTDADRATAVAEVWAEDGGYTDPLVSVRGRSAVADVLAGARAQFPGFEFRLAGPVDAHHDTARFTWELVPAAGGESLVVGFDVIAVDGAGKLRDVYGFLDKVPSA